MSGPQWRVLAEQLERDIRSGNLKLGERLPSLTEHAERGISQTTVLRVYRLLAERGLVESFPGRGTFVAESIPQASATLEQRVADLERRLDEHERGHA